MIKVNTKVYGLCKLQIVVEKSSVDSYLAAGYSETFGRPLTDDELTELQEDFTAEIQQYSYENGSIYHN